jgi:hypothetical protein
MYIYPHLQTYTHTYISIHIVRDDCERMMEKSFELHCAATEAVSAGRDSLTLESQVCLSHTHTHTHTHTRYLSLSLSLSLSHAHRQTDRQTDTHKHACSNIHLCKGIY